MVWLLAGTEGLEPHQPFLCLAVPSLPLPPALHPSDSIFAGLSEAQAAEHRRQRELAHLIKVSNEELCVFLNYCLSLWGEGLEWDFFFFLFFTCFLI